MSNKALNWARNVILPRGEKALLLMLSNSFNDKKGCCYPTNKTLAKWCGCKERTIRRYIKSLISKNIIQKIGEIRNQLGHKVTTKYSINFDLNIESLPDNYACGKLPSLPDNHDTPTGQLNQPTGQIVRKDYILNQSIKPKENKNISLGVDFNEQKIQTAIGIKFEQLRKIDEDEYDLEKAKKLYMQICLENKHPLQFADNLITVKMQQAKDRIRLGKIGKFVAAHCSLTNWLDGKRWVDKIKPLGDKKKVITCVKCKRCGEEYLKGTTCRLCEELAKTRLVYA